MSATKNGSVQDTVEKREEHEGIERVEDPRVVERPEAVKKDLTIRLNRLEGQIRGIKGMVERGCYCDDLFTQISSVKSALSSINKILLDSHIKGCIVEELRAGDEETIELLIKTIGRMM